MKLAEQPHAWTPDRIDTLKRLWANGQSCSQIAKALGGGCTRNAVIGKVHRLDLPERITVSRPVRAYTGPKSPRLSRAPSARRAPRTPEGPPLPPPPPVMAAPSLAVSLPALIANQCRWPSGEGADATFCGHPVRPGKSYCAGHCAGHCAAAYAPAKRPVYVPGHGRVRKPGVNWPVNLEVAA